MSSVEQAGSRPPVGPRSRVIVADDHPLFRDGLIRRIRERSELEVLAEAADGSAALELIRSLRPDVAVLDLKMPGMDGLEVARALAGDRVQARLVILSAYVESSLVFEALGAGVRAFVSKDADRHDVCEAIVAVARGEVVLPPALHSGLAAEIQSRARESQPALSTREREVLELIAKGASAPRVARELHLSTGTVKAHLAGLYEKLGVNDRAAAVAEAMRRGMLE